MTWFALAVVLWTAGTPLAQDPSEEFQDQVVAPKAHWPQWRGPNRDNISLETGLLQSWPEGGPPLSWSVKGIGGGIAAPAVSGGRVYVVGFIDDTEYLTALEQETGRKLWQTKIGKTVRESRLMRWLGQRMPTVDLKLVYAFSGDGALSALDVKTGRVIWRKSHSELGGVPHRWHHCDYPLVDGPLLVTTPGGKGAVVALTKTSGHVAWKSRGINAPSAHAALVPLRIDGVRHYVTLLQGPLVGILPRNGKVLWTHGPVGRGIWSCTPILHKKSIYLAAGYGIGLTRLDVAREGGALRVTEVYSNRKLKLSVFQDSGLIHDGHLYLVGGTVGLHCIDPETGEPVHQTRDIGRGNSSMVFADGRLYVRDTKGTVILVKPSLEAFVETGRFSIPPEGRVSGSSNPVIAGGRLFLREEDRLFSYDVKKKARTPVVLSAPTVLQKLAPPSPPPPSPPAPKTEKTSDAVYVATPHDVVERMLSSAAVRSTDSVYDLGSGDGRIVIAASAMYRAKGVGVEIEPKLVEQSRARIAGKNLGNLVRIEQADLFTVDLAPASVVACYLPEDLLLRLLPRFARLRRGSRIVSHQFKIPGIEPDRTISVESKEDGEIHKIYVWMAPLKPPLKPGQEHFSCRNCGSPVAGWPGSVTNCPGCRRSYVYPKED